MNIFGGVEQSEFDSFREEVLAKFKSLEHEISIKATDSEQVARVAAENATAEQLRVQSIGHQIDQVLNDLSKSRDDLKNEFSNISKTREYLTASSNELLDEIATTKAISEQLRSAKTEADKAVNEISENVEKINSYLSESEHFPESVTKTRELLEESEELSEKISSVLTHALKKKSDIDDLHRTIHGIDIKSEDGEIEHTDGLKDDLERSYNLISEKLDGLDHEAQKAISLLSTKHERILDAQRTEFGNLISKSDAEFQGISTQLRGLLPGSMAAGLSAAYEKKTSDETEVLHKFEQAFRRSILALVAISIIPFAVDVYLLGVQGKELLDVIKDTPSLILSILPLYLPVLWLAYSSNKKVNLSKRLIEEYTHKSVLGRTFSGLSNQIETLPHQSNVKDELRTRLLFNVLQVSAENPGKLISNYDKSDHPLMDALENSAKLSDAVDALSRIPGFSTIAQRLSEKSVDLVSEQAEKVRKGLLAHESLEPPNDLSNNDQHEKAA